MHLEFYRILTETARSANWWNAPGADDLRSELFERVWPNVESTLPPEEINAAVTSNAAFVLAAAAKRARADQREGDVTPLRVATALQEALHAKWGHLFSVSIGGLGHLNALPTLELITRFMSVLDERGASILTTRASLVTGSLTGHEPEAAEKFHVRVDFSALRERAVAGGDADAAALLNYIAEIEPGDDDRLMLMAVLADTEIEARPYLQKLGRRENVPWYIRRFSGDWRKLMKLISEAPRQRELGWASPWQEQHAEDLRRGDLFDAGLFEALKDLLLFRRAAETAEREGAPEYLLRQLLKIIRAFYSYYNLPQCRALTLSSGSPFNLDALGLITRCCGEVVEESLSSMDFKRFVASL